MKQGAFVKQQIYHGQIAHKAGNGEQGTYPLALAKRQPHAQAGDGQDKVGVHKPGEGGQVNSRRPLDPAQPQRKGGAQQQDKGQIGQCFPPLEGSGARVQAQQLPQLSHLQIPPRPAAQPDKQVQQKQQALPEQHAAYILCHVQLYYQQGKKGGGAYKMAHRMEQQRTAAVRKGLGGQSRHGAKAYTGQHRQK